MAVNFYVANNVKEAFISKLYVPVDDELEVLIYKNKHIISPEADLLLNLDPYGDKVFSISEIDLLMDISNLLYERVSESEVKKFAKDLFSLCETAKKQKKLIVALGD
ncbi:hypothetical protein AWH56_018280 [Anaerobacillus isosaccharinicus]|uniref:Uncharacterized protein n=1 Tax=Anaerobacillus isosaccharinicus TaxID=1532552 RepID=A0A1S2LEN3_9BACI|nr:hypothetical protein [Anaerobacillus isosaccharinicus]MBA5587146.1 hypothetical protein [Anaerobacillus isosaccharinicus]QOY34657.1 hypothetical protein AWH56_018280 [Anaerobacillus isosaccharinicus]